MLDKPNARRIRVNRQIINPSRNADEPTINSKQPATTVAAATVVNKLTPTPINNEEESPEEKLMKEIVRKYPVLEDKQLIKRFLAVPINNNQKGRLRQKLRDDLRASSAELDPDVINRRIESIIQSANQLIDSDLRKIRILHNMLKTAAIKKESTEKPPEPKKTKKLSKLRTVKKKDMTTSTQAERIVSVGDGGGQPSAAATTAGSGGVVKKEKKKRYIVFVGNLPTNIDTQTLARHFSKLSNSIKDIRIPKVKPDRSATAYVELKDEYSYQMALSQHHSMLCNRRINVLYTAGKNVNPVKTKGKVSKMIALKKTGKLIGSIPMEKKRSFRRAKKKQAGEQTQ